jgi:hypothetical protein
LTTRAEATDRQPKAPAAERRASRSLHPARALLAVVAGIPAAASAQDLEPRAYSPAPIGANFLGVLYQHSTGGASFDPSFPVKNARVTVEAPAVYYSRTFDLLGRQASAALVLPYAWADAKADVFDQPRAGRRSGSGDPRSRLAANLIGGPALDLDEFLKRPPSTSVGTSLTVVAPFGQHYSDRLFNIGSNRWALKPDIGLSQPFGPWSAELSGGAWLFTANDHFFGRTSREQDPILTAQAHRQLHALPRAVAFRRCDLLRRRPDHGRRHP